MSARIGDMPEHERPRERLKRLGPMALSDRELLALVLRNGRQGASAIDVANELIATFGSLAEISNAHADEVARVSGVGEAKAGAIVAAFHLATRAQGNSDPEVIRTPQDIARIAMSVLSHKRRECTIALICDAGNNLKQIATISEGALDHAMLPVRETLHAVLRHDGKAFAVAHNHPSGNPKPSTADVAITRQLMTGADTVGLRFLDHIVVAGQKWERAVTGFSQ